MYVITVDRPIEAKELIESSTYGVQVDVQGNNLIVRYDKNSGLLPEVQDRLVQQFPEYEREIRHNQVQLIALALLLVAGGIGVYYLYKIGGAVAETVSETIRALKPILILGLGGVFTAVIYYMFTRPRTTIYYGYEATRRAVPYVERYARAGYEVTRGIARGAERELRELMRR